MSAQRRTFTKEEKLSILQLAKQPGITKVLKQHNLSYSVFSRWKKQFGAIPPINDDEDVVHLKQENMLLKKIVAEQALQLEMKKEQIKNKEH